MPCESPRSLSSWSFCISAGVAAQEIVSKTAKLGDQNKTNMKAGVVYQVVVESDAFYPARDRTDAVNGEINRNSAAIFVSFSTSASEGASHRRLA